MNWIEESRKTAINPFNPKSLHSPSFAPIYRGGVNNLEFATPVDFLKDWKNVLSLQTTSNVSLVANEGEGRHDELSVFI